MAKIKLDLSEVAQLNQELFLLQQEKDLPFTVKYQLSKLTERTTSIVKKFNDLRNEIIEKYGVLVEGTKEFTLKDAKDEVKGTDEIKKLMETTEEFSETYSLSDFSSLKSDKHYLKIMLFLKE